MNILCKLPRDVFEHTLTFYTPVVPSARCIRTLIQSIDTFRQELSEIGGADYKLLMEKHACQQNYIDSEWFVKWLSHPTIQATKRRAWCMRDFYFDNFYMQFYV